MLKMTLTAIFMMTADTTGATVAEPPHANAQPDTAVFTSPGKPQHPLQVELEWDGKPETGVALPVSVSVSSAFDISDVNVSFATSPGLTLESQPQRYLQKLSGDADSDFSLQVTPASDGRHEIRVTITARNGDQTWSRELVRHVPVGVVSAQSRNDVVTVETVTAADGVEERRVPGRQQVEREQ